jgi:hypothetical protein
VKFQYSSNSSYKNNIHGYFGISEGILHMMVDNEQYKYLHKACGDGTLSSENICDNLMDIYQEI